MKKSKILAPALALTIFSTAAAVTGTVAWYFAQRAVSVKATVTSFNPEAGLKVTLHDGSGAKAVSGKETSVSPANAAEIEHELIRDGSADLADEKVYGAKYNRASDGKPTSFKEIDAAAHPDQLKAGETYDDPETTDVDESKPYYYATKYTATFELTKKNAGIKYALYYDNLGLAVNGESSIQESLRIGFVTHEITTEDNPATTDVDETEKEVSNYFVVAPFRDSADDYDTTAADKDIGKFVNSTDANAARGNYTDVDPADGDDHIDNRMIFGYKTKLEAIMQEDDPATTDVDESENPVTDEYGNQKYTASVDSTADDLVDNLDGIGDTVAEADVENYLGYLGNLENADEIEVTVYTWFEGEDPHSASNYVDGNPIETNLRFSLIEIEE